MKVSLFSKFLLLCKEADNLIRELVAKSPRLHGKRSTSLKAAAIHYLSRKRGLHVTMRDLYLLYGCMHKTIIDNERIIRNLVEGNK